MFTFNISVPDWAFILDPWLQWSFSHYNSLLTVNTCIWILDFLQASQQAAIMAVEDEDENDDTGYNWQ
jgi:hypothetical protein